MHLSPPHHQWIQDQRAKHDVDPLTYWDYDARVWSRIVKCLDRQEHLWFDKMRMPLMILGIMGSGARDGLDMVDKDWLKAAPLDIIAFGRFCNNPQEGPYASKQRLALELFSWESFVNPPDGAEIISCAQKHWLQTIARLSRTVPIRFGLPERVCQKLTGIWEREVGNLPDSV